MNSTILIVSVTFWMDKVRIASKPSDNPEDILTFIVGEESTLLGTHMLRRNNDADARADYFKHNKNTY